MAKSAAKISEFDPENEKISEHLEHLHLYFKASDIANTKKVSVLLTVSESKTYSLLRGHWLAPTLPKDKPFKNLEKLLKDHFEPKPLVIAECHRKKSVYNHCNVEIYSQFAILEIFCNLCISEIE